MKIFLAGATGAIGERLVPLLRSGGHSVVGTTRSPSKAARLRASGTDAVVFDALDGPGTSISRESEGVRLARVRKFPHVKEGAGDAEVSRWLPELARDLL
jgi:nucleoside-diphosphate-sugar epimerase